MTRLVDQLVKHLHDQKGWVPKGHILLQTFKDDRGVAYMADTTSRKLREAEEERRIAVKYEGKKTLYKWIPHELRDKYICTSSRLPGLEDKLFRG